MSQYPYQRVIVFLADGSRPDVLGEEMKKGHLPHMARYFAESGTSTTMLTCFPSTTGPAYLPYLTGCFPGTCNVPGIRWFDKPQYQKTGWGWKAFRSYVGLESFFFNRDVAKEIKSVWEVYQNPKNILNIITKGLTRKSDLTFWNRIFLFYYGHLTDRWKFLDDQAYLRLRDLIRQKDFDYCFMVFPSVDEYSHQSSPFHPRVRQAYQEIDAVLGNTISELKESGIYDETLILIVSDHGLSETHTHFDIGPWLEEEKKLKTFFYTNIFKFKFDAVSMVSGNGMTHLYFKTQKGWGERKSFEEISHESILLDELRHRKEVDVVSAYGVDHAIHILNEKGHGWFKVDPESKKIKYEFDRHGDPLEIFQSDDERLVDGFTFDEALAWSFHSHYPDIFMQLYQVYQSPRCGDVIVTAKSGYDLRYRYEHPLHKASHGSLCPEHMKIPLLINHPIQKDFIRSVDVFPTVLELTGKKLPKILDGKSLL